MGALLCADVRLLAVAFLAVAVLSYLGGVADRFLRFIAIVMLPFAIILGSVWVGLMGAPPGVPMGTDRLAALQYITLIILRLAVCSGLFQVLLLSITPEELLAALRRLGLSDDFTIMGLSTIALIPELTLRADQVLTARLARGLFGRQGLPNRVLQLPYILTPLVSWTLRSALQRAELWEHRGLIEKLRCLPCTATYSVHSSLVLTLLASVFLGLAVRTRFH